MRFLKSFLANNTILKVVPKPTKPSDEPTNTYRGAVPKLPEHSWVGFGTSRTLVIREEDPKRGIKAAHVLAAFPDAKVIALHKPLRCDHCAGDLVPEWRRGGKIVERTWPDGRKEWACRYCGRAV